MRQSIRLFYALILVMATSCGPSNKKSGTTQHIEKYLSELEKAGLNGSVLVALNGETVTSKSFGYCNKEESIRNTPYTLFDIGSITKQFTAAAILKLEMQGRLSTEDPITKYFDNVPKDKATITIHDLLRHQSGLVSNVGGDYEKISREVF